MHYWINSKDVQSGPFSLAQLQVMWDQGILTVHTYYYDSVRSEWFALQTLLERVRGLFTVEEAFVRLGQNRQKGCLVVFNNEETLHIYVDAGFVVCALSPKEEERGEFALGRALKLEGSGYEWFFDLEAPTSNMRLNITEYAMRTALARDVRVGQAVANRKHNTVAIPQAALAKVEAKLKFNYILVSTINPALRLRVVKINNIVGRGDDCDIMIDDGQVSRKHCLLEVWEQNVKVKDLDSSNGTFINAVPVRDGYLRDGDMLSLGGYKVILEKEQKKAPAMT